jgi:pyruvate dehydrogenase E1 component beta subunit
MRQVSFVQAIREALAEEMARDERVFVMGEDVRLGAFAATKGLYEKFGAARVRNAPLSEAGFAGAGVGAAMAGMRPVVEIEFGSFLYYCWDQVCNQAAKLRYMSGGQLSIPITFRCVNGAIGSAAAQHSETVYGQLLGAPGLKLVIPSCPSDMKGLLKTAIRDDDPVVVFEHGRLGRMREPVPEGEHLVPLGVAARRREGSDVTVVAFGLMVSRAIAATEALAGEGISVEVIDPRTLVPLDEETILSSVAKTGRLVVVDEGHLRGGAASDITALVAEKGFDLLRAPIRRVAALDVPIPFSPPLEEQVVPSEARIRDAIRGLAA